MEQDILPIIKINRFVPGLRLVKEVCRSCYHLSDEQFDETWELDVKTYGEGLCKYIVYYWMGEEQKIDIPPMSCGKAFEHLVLQTKSPKSEC